MQIEFAFWTPGHTPADAQGARSRAQPASADDGKLFGGSSHGFAAHSVWTDPAAAGIATWPVMLRNP